MLKKTMWILASLAVLAAPMTAQGNGKGRGPGGMGGFGTGGGFDGGMEALLTGLPMEDLSAPERTALLHMRQEEKLARDVYLTLNEAWNLRLFRNIARSEERHMFAVRVMLQKYGLSDPAGDDTVGIFTDPEMQVLFNDLTARGRVSLEAALEVGALIEDLDIFDLKRALKKSDSQDVRVLFQNLQKGSRNHLRAYLRQMERYQLRYEARYLTPEEIEDIANSPMERGVYDQEGKPFFGNTDW